MTWTPTYHERNLKNIAKLAPNTKAAATKWYEWCVANKVNVLIYETIRTVEQQKKNVAAGKSQTMQSYHLVGQALDFVGIDAKGKELWSAYGKEPFIRAIEQAEKIGFESGHRWGWDSPHLQYNWKGYGTDKELAAQAVQKDEGNGKHIGRITLLRDTSVYEKPTGKSTVVRTLKAGTKLNVFSTAAGFHCISAGMYVMVKDCDFTKF